MEGRRCNSRSALNDLEISKIMGGGGGGGGWGRGGIW